MVSCFLTSQISKITRLPNGNYTLAATNLFSAIQSYNKWYIWYMSGYGRLYHITSFGCPEPFMYYTNRPRPLFRWGVGVSADQALRSYKWSYIRLAARVSRWQNQWGFRLTRWQILFPNAPFPFFNCAERRIITSSPSHIYPTEKAFRVSNTEALGKLFWVFLKSDA